MNADVLLRACKRILRPLIKAMIAHGITLPAVLSVLKQVYVEVAVDSFGLDGKPITDSRVSMLTGVHRKDVRTVRERGVPATAPPGLSVGATVVGRWLGDPRFVDAAGKPKASGPGGRGRHRSTRWSPRPASTFARARCWTSCSARVWSRSTRQRTGSRCWSTPSCRATTARRSSTSSRATCTTTPPPPPTTCWRHPARRPTWSAPSTTTACVQCRSTRWRAPLASSPPTRWRSSTPRRWRCRPATGMKPEAAERFRFGVYFYRAPQRIDGDDKA